MHPGSARTRPGSWLPVGLSLLLVGAGSAQLHADPLDLDPIPVRDRRVEPGTAAAEDTVFSSQLDAGRATLEGGGLIELLAGSVGVQVRRLGSEHDLASVLIRGSTAGQVGIFLDGIPVAVGRGGLVDLSLFPPVSLERVEVFRGFVPAELGAEGMGGAINLIPGRAGAKPVTRILAGLGSFGSGQLGLSRSERRGAVEYALTGTIQASRGDFRFLDDRGTRYNPEDDRFTGRINNDGFLLAALGWVRIKLRKHVTLTLLESFSLKEKGVPGPGFAQAEHTRIWALHQVLDAKLDHRRFLHRNLTAMVRLNVQVTEDRFRNPKTELGSGVQDQRDRAVTAGVVGRLSWAPHAPQLLSLVPEWRLETYEGRDPAADRAGLGQLPRSRRYRFALALRDQIVLWKERLSLTPALRLDALYTDVTGTTTGGDPLRNAHAAFLSPRFGVKVKLARGVSLRGNAGRYFRPPTVLELYGDRGTSIGNPELTSESGWGGDAGVVVDLRRRWRWLPRLLLEASGFGREARDLIQWMMNPQRTAQARNVARARAAGLEAVLGAWLRLHGRVSARLTASYTFLHTENLSGQPLIDGNRLPGRPLHELDVRADLAVRWRRLRVAVHYAISHVTDSFLDEANEFDSVPRRTLHDIGLLLDPGVPGLTVAVTLRNLANARVEHQTAPAFTGLASIPRPLQDYGGYPLPGRSFLVTLSWTH